jgi:cytochrome c-type biogenesis protein CcmH
MAEMNIFGVLLLLLALILLVAPMLRYRREPWVTPVLCLILVGFPAGVIAIYLNATTYNWQEQQEMAAPDPSAPPVDEMIRELAVRLKAEPDLEGWTLLARSYTSLSRYQDAADAWYEAWTMTGGEDPEVAISYAEALIMADNRTLRTSAADLLDKALLAAPREPRALWYGGLSAAARGQKQLAADRWTLLLKADLPDNMRSLVQQQLAALSLDGTNQADARPVASILATITINSELQQQAEPGDLMFLIARDLDQPMPPVAVKRVQVGDFPVTIRISDNDVMIPGKRLEDVKNLLLIARISKSGKAFAEPGDLYGESKPGRDEDGFLGTSILINRVLQDE